VFYSYFEEEGQQLQIELCTRAAWRKDMFQEWVGEACLTSLRVCQTT